VAAPQFLVHSPKDNVGVVVVEGLKKGADMLGVITETDKTMKLKAKDDIPIGRMTADTGVGEHVHVQNLKTKRW
jgi:(2R)-sulfolactate sulfo-lyase subunit alpha